jgi:putrescine transport system substrate-binding protein
MRRSIYIALLCLLPAACGRPAADEAVVNIYNWYDYVKPEVLREFTARYGIQVRYNTFDSNNTLEARMLAGHSGYDVVFPSGAYLESMVKAGVFRPLDTAELPNLANLDATIMQRLAVHDSGNAHAVVYTWGITGIAYDEAKVRARLPGVPLDSWSMLFDPTVASRLADCGIGLYEAPNIIVPSVLAWLGDPPNSETVDNLERARSALMAVRPFISNKITRSQVV